QSESPPQDRARLRSFFVSATCLVIAGGLARAELHAPFVPELMADALFRWLPLPVFSLAIGWLGGTAKWVALAGCIILYWVGAAVVGQALCSLAQRLGPPAGDARYRAATALLSALLV